MVPAGTQTIAYGPLMGSDGKSSVIIELLYKAETAEFFGYHPDLPMAFPLDVEEVKRIVFHPKAINRIKVICGHYPNPTALAWAFGCSVATHYHHSYAGPARLAAQCREAIWYFTEA